VDDREIRVGDVFLFVADVPSQRDDVGPQRDVLLSFDDDVLLLGAVVPVLSAVVSLRSHVVDLLGGDRGLSGHVVDLLVDVRAELDANVSFFGDVVSPRLGDVSLLVGRVSLFVDDVGLFLDDVSLLADDVLEEADDGSEHRDVLGELLPNRRLKVADGDPIRAVVDANLDVLVSLADERSSFCPVLSPRDCDLSEHRRRRDRDRDRDRGHLLPMNRKSRCPTVGGRRRPP
jgi:hypothetical protein